MRVTETEEVVAYEGEYGTFDATKIAMDLVYLVPLGKETKSHVLLNAYFRDNDFNTMMLRDDENIGGIGSYFFKEDGKFIGGLYIQINDLAKTIDRKNLSFGIVAKYQFDSILKFKG